MFINDNVGIPPTAISPTGTTGSYRRETKSLTTPLTGPVNTMQGHSTSLKSTSKLTTLTTPTLTTHTPKLTTPTHTTDTPKLTTPTHTTDTLKLSTPTLTTDTLKLSTPTLTTDTLKLSTPTLTTDTLKLSTPTPTTHILKHYTPTLTTDTPTLTTEIPKLTTERLKLTKPTLKLTIPIITQDTLKFTTPTLTTPTRTTRTLTAPTPTLTTPTLTTPTLTTRTRTTPILTRVSLTSQSDTMIDPSSTTSTSDYLANRTDQLSLKSSQIKQITETTNPSIHKPETTLPLMPILRTAITSRYIAYPPTFPQIPVISTGASVGPPLSSLPFTAEQSHATTQHRRALTTLATPTPPPSVPSVMLSDPDWRYTEMTSSPEMTSQPDTPASQFETRILADLRRLHTENEAALLIGLLTAGVILVIAVVAMFSRFRFCSRFPLRRNVRLIDEYTHLKTESDDEDEDD